MAERIDVFISSTSRDLAVYRDAVARIILRLGMYPIDMANFNPTDRNALQLCYDKVEEAEIFIGIYAHRYGYAPDSTVTYTTADGETHTGDGDTGITHLEYRWAVERRLPMLLFVVDEDVPWPPKHIEDEPGKSRLKDFKALIGKHHVWGTFSTPDNLATQVATGLAELKARISPHEPSDTPKRRDFYKYINLPPNYVPRHELLAELRLALLGDTNIALTSAIKGATALHGMGGIGKSVMARALCDDPAVQAAYPDGILWASLGQEPDVSAKLREWIHALGGMISEGTPSVDSLKVTLAELLADRACLLIVDDVWQKKHGDTFRVSGDKCRLLMTTRDAEVARSLGASITSIPIMSESEALDLLKQWADGNLAEADGDVLTTIVRELGRLPLALKLAGAQLQRKSPKKWLEGFDARKLEARRGDEDDPHSSLERCFGMSLSELKDAERKLYAALAIFKEDEPIREMAIVRLWAGLDDLDEDEAQDLLDDLAARALLEMAGDAYPRAAILHNLLRDFIAAELDDAGAAHQVLLDAYAETQTGDGWHTTPPDGYIYENLAYHLMAVGQAETLRGLLLDYRYLQAKLDATDVNALIDDCAICVRTEQNRDTVQLLMSALNLSHHILSEDKSALAHQMSGRLVMHENIGDIARLMASIRYPENSLYYVNLGKMYPPLIPAGGMLLRTLKGHTKRIYATQLLSDDRILSWSDDMSLRLWSKSGDPLKPILEGHRSPIRGAKQLPDGRLMSWSDDHTIRLWSSTGHIEAELSGHTAEIRGVIPDNNERFLSWSEDGTLRLWTSEGLAIEAVMEGHKGAVRGVSFLNNGRILSWSEDGTLRLWTSEGLAIEPVMEGHKGAVRGVNLLDNSRILSWSEDGTLRLWTLDDLTVEPVLMEHANGGQVLGMLMLENGNLVSWGSNKQVYLWTQSGQLLNEFELHEHHDRDVKGMIEVQGNLVSWSSGQTPILWDSSGKYLRSMTGHRQGIIDVMRTSDNRLLSWSEDGTLHLWTAEGESIAVLEGHTNTINGAIELSTGKLLSWSSDFTCRLWAANGDPLVIFEGHNNSINGACSLRDGRILSWSEDCTLRIWKIESEIVPEIDVSKRERITQLYRLSDHCLLMRAHNRILSLWNRDGKKRDLGDVPFDGALLLRDDHILIWSEDHRLSLWDSNGSQVSKVKVDYISFMQGIIELKTGHLVSWTKDGSIIYFYRNKQQITATVSIDKHDKSINGVLELSDGRLLSWSDDGTLRLWLQGNLESQVLTPPLSIADYYLAEEADDDEFTSKRTVYSPETAPVKGAMQLTNGRILSRSDPHTLQLWATDGTFLAKFDQDNIDHWLKENSIEIEAEEIFPSKYQGQSSISLQQDHFEYTSPENGEISRVFFDTPPEEYFEVKSGKGVVARDAVGRVLFLRWSGEG